MQKRSAEESVQTATRYLEGFNRLVTAVADAQALAFVTMVTQAEEFADLVAKTIASQADVRNATLTNAQTDMENTSTLLIGMAVGAFAIGILIALVTARSIVRPVVDMTGTMTDLAAGNLSVDVPALENRDEIGRMARAGAGVQGERPSRRSGWTRRNASGWRPNAAPPRPQRAREQAIGEEIATLIDAVSEGQSGAPHRSRRQGRLLPDDV